MPNGALLATRYSPFSGQILHFWLVFSPFRLDSRLSQAISPGIRRGISRAACFCANSRGLIPGRAKIVPITTDQKADPDSPVGNVRGRDRTRRNRTMFA